MQSWLNGNFHYLRTVATDKEIDDFLARVEKQGYLMARIATSSSEDALDLLQDTMLAFVQHYKSRNQEQWLALFFRILQNRIRDWYRWNKVRNKWRAWFGGSGNDHSTTDNDSKAFIENQSGSRFNEPFERLNGSAFNEALLEALRSLPLRQQQAFMLRTWQGLSEMETAAIMRISQGSVKTHLFRATKVLRDKLEDFQ